MEGLALYGGEKRPVLTSQRSRRMHQDLLEEHGKAYLIELLGALCIYIVRGISVLVSTHLRSMGRGRCLSDLGHGED